MNNEYLAKLLVDQLVRQGVEYFCLSPGSRSTPLALAVAEHPRARSFIHFDERGSAFHAVGWAKARGKPAVVISTSGTAVGNFFPAVMEAALSFAPLIVLTADRPPELRDCGSNQTLDQVKIFGSYVRWQADLPCPTPDLNPDLGNNFFASTVAYALFRAQHAPAGPVHLNCMFREPLLSTPASYPTVEGTKYGMSHTIPSESALEEWGRLLSDEQEGVIVVGELPPGSGVAPIAALAKKLNWPVFADILSQARQNPDSSHIRYYDSILKTKPTLQPKSILYLGGRLISKTLQQWIAALPLKVYAHVADHPLRQDPAHLLTHRLESDPARFCQMVLPHCASHASGWHQEWKAQEEKIAETLQELFEEEKTLTEPTLAHFLRNNLPAEWALFFANSMPVRDADFFLFPEEKKGPFFGNRGVSGIDGNIATVCGLAAGTNRPTLAILGDLAALHDLNSLAMVKKVKEPVHLLIINNSGGGIFSFLPGISKSAHFEEFFATAHTFTFEKAAAAFDIPYFSPRTEQDLAAVLKEKHSCVIEVFTNREENKLLHDKITERCSLISAAVR